MNAPDSGSHKDADAALRFGLLCAVGAYLLWGVMPPYIKAIGHVPPIEIVAHRILWSIPFGAILIVLRQQWPEVRTAFADRRVLLMLTLSALMIAGNWLIYVWAIAQENILEASLGYFINPLMYVAAGVFVLGEKLRRAQIIAVGMATFGVIVLTIGSGAFPWTAITLAALFTAYGYVRKTTPVGAMPGLFIETSLLAPIAFLYLLWLSAMGSGSFGPADLETDVLLVLAGPVTVLPLVLFALAARRLRLSTIGFLQYMAPTMQFLFALYYGETFTLAHAICFGSIWIALAVFSFDAVRANRAEKRARISQGA